MGDVLTTKDGAKLARVHDDGLDIFLGDTVVLRLEKSGHVYIKNQLVSIDIEVLQGVVELLKNLESGDVAEAVAVIVGVARPLQ